MFSRYQDNHRHARPVCLPLRNSHFAISWARRYALGCWETDAYVAKYGLPATGCVNGVPDSSKFYTNAGAIADVRCRPPTAYLLLTIPYQFDNRLRHILNFQSPKFGVPWHKLSGILLDM